MPSVTAKQADLARTLPLAERITVRYHEAAVLSGLPLTKIQGLVAAGTLKSTKVGRSRLIQVKSLRALLEGQVPVRRRRQGRGVSHGKPRATSLPRLRVPRAAPCADTDGTHPRTYEDALRAAHGLCRMRLPQQEGEGARGGRSRVAGPVAEAT
jgi:excisionase family DNA binding protein